MKFLVFLTSITIVYADCIKGDAPAAPENGKLVFDVTADPVNEGSKARLICRGGYRQDNSLALTCKDGNWTGDVGECVAQGCRKKHLDEIFGPSGQLSYEPEAAGEYAEHLSLATVGCQDAYNLKSTNTNGQLRCQSDTYVVGFEDLTTDQTFVCHFGTWVGRVGGSQCVAQRNKTDLETACESIPTSFYTRSSCFVASSTEKMYEVAKTSCTDFPLGHLAFVATARTLAGFHGIKDGLLQTRHLTGLLQPSGSSEPYGGWLWAWNTTLRWVLPRWDMVQWEPGQPDDNIGPEYIGHGTAGVLWPQMDRFVDGYISETMPYLCQYHEPIEHAYELVGPDTRGPADTLLSLFESLSLGECAYECNKVAVCDSFSFNQSNGTCLLQWLDGITLPASYGPIHQQGFSMYRVH